MFVCL